MSRSYRKPAHYFAGGIDPKAGKRFTSKAIRRRVNSACSQWSDDDDLFFGVQDKNRGAAGSREFDRGWRYFGDGRVKPAQVDPVDAVKMSRK